jgi:serine/threonine-protein kinase ULK2
MAGTADTPVQRTASSSKRPEDDELRPYVIVGDLGKGSFATVYKGYNEVSLEQSRSLWLACSRQG